MQTICPAYDGSVSTSWYPVIAVLKTTSPSPTTSAPNATPTNARPSSSTRAAKGLSAGNDHRLVDAVVFKHQDLDSLGVRGGHVLPHVIGPDRKLAVPAVDEHRQLDRARASEVHQRVHGGARGAAVMDHVVDQHDHLAVDGRHLGGGAMRGLAQVPVVAMRGHVEPPHRDAAALQLGQDGRQTPREDVPLAHDTDKDHIVGAAIALD